VWIPSGGDYYYAVFWEGMPDLDYHNPEVTEAMYEAADFWLTEMGVDGFRLDAIKHLIENGRIQENTNETHAWLQDFYQEVQSVKTEAFLVGEAWTATAQAVKYTENETDIVFEFDLAQAILRSAGFGTVSSVRNAQNKVLDNYRQGQYAVFLTNHDQDRVMNVLADVDKAKVAAALLLTNPGVPFIYYGEEIGMVGRKPDEDIRRPMQWDATEGSAGFSTASRVWRPPDSSYKTVNVESQRDDPRSLWRYYRDLISLRNTHAALRVGDMIILDTDARKVYSYLRYTDDEALLVIINMDDEPVQNFTLSLAEGPLSNVSEVIALFGSASEVTMLNLNADGGFDAYAPIPWMAPHSTVIIGLY
jgi:glycosidase